MEENNIDELKWKLIELTRRERDEVLLAEVYTASFAHGTDGHNRLMLIAKLSKLLTQLLPEVVPVKEYMD